MLCKHYDLIYVLVFLKVVGSIDQMDVDDTANAEGTPGSATDSKNNVDPNKGKGKRKLYVGSQAMSYRRDNMEVSLLIFFLFPTIIF